MRHAPRQSGTVLVVMVGMSTILIGLILMLNLSAKQTLDNTRSTVKQAQAIIMANAMIAYLSPYWDTNRTTFSSFGTSANSLSSPGLPAGWDKVILPARELTGTRTDLGNGFPGAKYLGAAYGTFSGSDLYVAGVGGPGYPAYMSTAYDTSAKNTNLANQTRPYDSVLWLTCTPTGSLWDFTPSNGIAAQSLTNAPTWSAP